MPTPATCGGRKSVKGVRAKVDRNRRPIVGPLPMRTAALTRRVPSAALAVAFAMLVAALDGFTVLPAVPGAGPAVLIAVAILLAAIASRSPRPARSVWVLLAVHLGMLAGAALTMGTLSLIGTGDPPTGVGDLITLMADAPLVAALVRIAASTADSRVQDVFVDAAAVAIVAGLAIFQFLLVGPDVAGSTAIPTLVRPIGDVFVVGALAALLFARVRPSGPVVMLMGYAATIVAVDLATMSATVHAVDARWLEVATSTTAIAGVGLLAGAALSRRSMLTRGRQGRHSGSIPRLTLLGIAIICAPALAVVLALGRQRTWIPLLVGAALGVSLLVMARLAGLVRRLEIERQRLSATEAHLAYQASHDALTGLPNRSLLTERLALEVAAARDAHRELALMFIDLDDFKLVNDTLGHGAGDDLLRVVSSRIEAEVAPDDMVGRVGGDEFVIVSPNLADRRSATRFADTILAAVCRPVTVAGRRIEPSASIGVALRGALTDPQALLANADLALYQAKRAGRSRARMFDQAMRQAANERAGIEAGLRRALDADEMAVAYQPRVDLATGRIASLEALARWPHRPDIAVSRFIEVAEATGIVEQLGRTILDRACGDIMWINRSRPQPPIRVSVNVSMRQLMQPDLVEIVRDTVQRHALPRDLLTLEITETFVAREPEFAARTLDEIRRLGVRIEIDDFGVGHTSFKTLSAFPIDGIKIDKSLVDGLGTHEPTEQIVTAIVAMAHALGLQTTVEGIEQADDLEVIRGLGADIGQGYLFSRPLPAETVDRLVATWPGLCPAAAAIADRAAVPTSARP